MSKPPSHKTQAGKPRRKCKKDTDPLPFPLPLWGGCFFKCFFGEVVFVFIYFLLPIKGRLRGSVISVPKRVSLCTGHKPR